MSDEINDPHGFWFGLDCTKCHEPLQDRKCVEQIHNTSWLLCNSCYDRLRAELATVTSQRDGLQAALLERNDTAIALADEARRYREALEAIVRHEDIVASAFMSTVAAMASRALASAPKEGS